jgi:spore coat protein A, manganese oxidase
VQVTINRRDFVFTGLAAAALAVSRPAYEAEPLPSLPLCGPGLRKVALRGKALPAGPALNAMRLPRFVDPLPIPPRARSLGLRSSPEDSGLKLPYYRMEMRECLAKLHRDLKPTRQWGYAGCVPGPTIYTRSGQGLLVEWVNALPQRHLLPVDFNIHGAEADKPEVRTVAHVHGAKVPPQADGYPEHWWPTGKSAVYHYPNQQEAATLWYHDHAMGITRLNLYAGLLGMFIVGDEAEDALELPSGDYDIPLMLYDRRLDLNGQLYYLTSGDPQAPWVPEFYDNTILCNGKLFPYLEVEPRPYRLRLLNAANGRSFYLHLSNGQPFRQIGSDAGLLPQPVDVPELELFPAERADVVVDFSGQGGASIQLLMGTQDLMQFRVRRAATGAAKPLPAKLRPLPRIAESEAVKTRTLTLGERDDYAGNSTKVLLNGTHWDAPVTEDPVLDTVEIWNLLNLTADAHPIHLHLVRFQILDRRPFDLFAYNASKTLKYTGPALPPPPQEAGWKDTVRTDPGMVTRIIVRFEGYTGRYVWHCHLLEHEDNEMMRPYEVLAKTVQVPPPDKV